MVTRTPLATEGRRTALVAVLVCWLFVVFDGYDLIADRHLAQASSTA